MKKDILITVCVVFLVSNLHAQQKNFFAYYNHQIDSLVSIYSIEKPMGDGGNYFFSFEDEKLSAKEKKNLIVKIRKMFKQDEYPNLYYLGHKLLYNMAFYHQNNNSPQIRQMLLETYLQYYFYPGKGKYELLIYIYDVKYKFDYTKKAKKRIVEILENKKTEEEYGLYIIERRAANRYYMNSTFGLDDANRIMKKREIKNDTILEQIRDSILEVRNVLPEAKRDFESAQIEPDLIRMIGILEMKECIPVLKQKLTHCIESDCLYGQEKAYRYALARLGDEEQRQYILDNLMDIGVFDRRDFSYFKDDEMIWKYIEVNRHSKTLVYTDSESHGVSASFMSIEYIYPYIKNLPEDKNLEYPNSRYMDDYFQWAQLFYEWLMKNKESVEFDYEGEKEFHW